MRDWLVFLDRHDYDNGRLSGSVSVVVASDCEEDIKALAMSEAHERYRVGNHVDGFFTVGGMVPLPVIGESVLVSVATEDGDNGPERFDFDPPVLATVTGYDSGKDASKGFSADVRDREGSLHLFPAELVVYSLVQA